MNNGTTMNRRQRARLVRAEADALLDQLMNERVAVEDRFQKLGRVDLLKSVTGTSSIDRAVSELRTLIAEMDSLLAEAEPMLEQPTNGTVRSTRFSPSGNSRQNRTADQPASSAVGTSG